jgi:GDPmannose 4,6-dehydratase
VSEAFGYLDLDWREYVEIDAKYLRPTEVDFLLADSSKARAVLGWEPKISFKDLVHIMVDADLDALSLAPVGEGKRILQDQFGDWHQWDKSVSRSLTAASGGLD